MIKLKDVAEYADVSISTVSRVMAGKEVVSEATRKKVLEAARVLDYRPNILAKSLKMGRSYTLSLMIPSIQNQIFPDIVRGVEDTARRCGYTVVLCNTDEDTEVEKAYIDKMKTSWADGFLVASMREDSQHFLDLRKDGVPVVLMNRYVDNSLDGVVIDNFQAAYEGTRFLLEGGHQNIVFAMGSTEIAIYQHRLDGYKKALRDANIPFREENVLYERAGNDSFYTLTKEYVKAYGPPDGIFASSDPKALVILRALHDLKIKIPKEVSVLGFDNIEYSALVEPPLTTISQPLYEIGALAAQKLIDQIEHKEKHGTLKKPQLDVLSTEIILRKSVQQRKGDF